MAFWAPLAVGAASAAASKLLAPKNKTKIPDFTKFFPDANLLGSEFSDFLRDRLSTPVENTREFARGKTALRDAINEEAGATRQRLGESANRGGFFDSGLVDRGMLQIDRQALTAYIQSLNQLMDQLEARRTEGVLPFLSGAATGQAQGASLSVQQGAGNQQAQGNMQSLFANLMLNWKQ